jgi:dTDP-4-dehydrorhamnose reductase
MRKKVLITGASGFLGGAIQSFLSHNKSFEIFSVDVKCISTKKRNFDCDLCNKEKVRSILLSIRPDYIFHLSSQR